MINRIVTKYIYDLLARFPAVTIVGPRQCGKTTLSKLFSTLCFDMETESDQIRLDAEWASLIEKPDTIVIDEAQQAPDIFPRLRSAIDADRKSNGRFLLLGSVSPALMVNVSESLAGRMAIVHLSPLLLSELEDTKLDELWLYGGYPDGGVLNPIMFPDWQRNYLELLAMRDLPHWGLSAKPSQTLRLLSMLAVIHGQLLNASQIGSSMALDHKTVLRHCDFLEEAFLIRRLQPFSINIRKRLVKTPRIYWRDSGLLHSLMNIGNMHQLYQQPWLGRSWEGFVIEQTLATLNALGKRVQPFHFRTSDGYELDLVLDCGNLIWALEIKLTSNPSPGDIEHFHKTADMIGAHKRVFICRVAEELITDRLWILNPSHWLKKIIEGRMPG